MRTVIIHSPSPVDDLREELEALPGVEVLGLGHTPSTAAELGIGVIVRTALSDYDLEGYLYVVHPADDAVFSDVPPPAHGLVGVYGDPARGFAGAYMPEAG